MPAKLVRCPGCGAQISSAATACPKCGHPRSKQTSIFTWVVGGFFAFVVGSCVIQQAIRNETRPAAPTVDPTVKAIMEKRETAHLTWVATGAAALMASSKDPETFEIRKATWFNDDTVCYEYRAKNSFNAMLLGRAVRQPTGVMLVQESSGNRFVTAWNKACAGDTSSGRDYGKDVQYIIHMKR